MKRVSQNQALYEVAAGELITVSVEAVAAPFEAAFSDLESGGHWAIIQQPTAQVPIARRSFIAPHGVREFFAIAYSFAPTAQRSTGAQYKITVSGAAGTSDGPEPVLPPFVGDLEDLPYQFRLTAKAPVVVAAGLGGGR
jgi:hypothetical protein